MRLLPRMMRAQGLRAFVWGRFMVCLYSHGGSRGIVFSFSNPEVVWKAYPGYIAALQKTAARAVSVAPSVTMH